MKSTKVSFFQAIAISFGAIIGWGAYVMPGDLFLSKGTLLSSSLAIILGTILIYIIAQSYVNLLSITPDNESGGVYWIYKYL
ncbi:TPA: APC family permease, partial [Mannheimia haemolytica]|nr:APC family permease [Mannheimia haemolytica]HDL5495566.1 APC family permease [Mannheimia haemolytica]HDL5814229.1 APC family permease [Mannheimia haemolytica]HDL5908674.1 APC family permease [Mannheimia haemolytica]